MHYCTISLGTPRDIKEYPNRVKSPCALQGVWRAAIHNPMRIYKIAYNLTTIKVARCLNNCSGHGTCSEDAICHCQVSLIPLVTIRILAQLYSCDICIKFEAQVQLRFVLHAG